MFRHGSDLFIQSRDLRPLDRYFPELRDALLANFERLRGRWRNRHPDAEGTRLRRAPVAASSRGVSRREISKDIPSAFVAFDVLAVDGHDVRTLPQSERRTLLERALARVSSPIHVTPMTRDRAQASDWLARFEGAGLDGVIAKPEHGTYEPGKRAMFKVKHARTADCVVGGFRWHKNGPGSLIGSLLLGLHDDRGNLHHVGVTSAFSMATRRELAHELERRFAIERSKDTRGANGPLRWEMAPPVCRVDRVDGAPEKICRGGAPRRACVRGECDHMQGDRFRHAAIFLRWRFDKQPKDCRCTINSRSPRHTSWIRSFVRRDQRATALPGLEERAPGLRARPEESAWPTEQLLPALWCTSCVLSSV